MQKQEQKTIVDNFTARTGIHATFCKSCDIWQVHCPECNRNWCGGYCDCGYNTLLDKQQTKLDEMLSARRHKRRKGKSY